MTNDLTFALKYYRGDVFAKWAEHLVFTTFNHGDTLVKMLGTPTSERPGLADNVYAAGKLLEAAEKAGWIVRADHASPSTEQRFFGVGGMAGKNPNIGVYAVAYGWSPGPNASEMQGWIKSIDNS